MSRTFAAPALALLLAATTVFTPRAHASGGDLNSSEAGVLVSMVLTLSIPLAASVGLVELSKAPFKASEQRSARKRVPAKPLPPMEVKDVTTDAQGCKVQLQVPGNAEQTATLQWPTRQDNPGAAFAVGETVAFVPTPAGAGWNVTDGGGKTLAYVPTEYAAADNLTGTW